MYASNKASRPGDTTEVMWFCRLVGCSMFIKEFLAVMNDNQADTLNMKSCTEWMHYLMRVTVAGDL